MPSPDQLTGPLGALVLALAGLGLAAKAIHTLWKEHLEADRDDRGQRDRAMALAETAIEGTRRMAEAWEERNRRDRERHRHDDEACLSKHPQPCAPAGCGPGPIHPAPFRCIGYDCERPGFVGGTPESRCGCPDFMEARQAP